MKEYLSKLSACMGPRDPYAHDDLQKDADSIRSVLLEVKDALPHLDRMLSRAHESPVKNAVTWLIHYNRYVSFLLQGQISFVKGNVQQAIDSLASASEYLMRSERDLFWATDFSTKRHQIDRLKQMYAAACGNI